MSERDVIVQQMWHEQPREEHAMSINEIRERAQRFERRVRRNNILTAVLIVVIVAVELWHLFGRALDRSPAQNAVIAVLAVALFIGTAWWHKRSARRLQREIDELGVG
jgi:hypothetical protein